MKAKKTTASGKDNTMGVKLVKSMSVRKDVITITSADCDDKPRKYTKQVIACSNEEALQESVMRVATSLFMCELRFLPSCDSKCHEAYIRTNDSMGGDSAYLLSQDVVPNTDEWLAFQDDWVEHFAHFALHGRHETGKYVLLHDFVPVTVRIHTDHHGNVDGLRYASTNMPKIVSYVTARIVTDHFGTTDDITMRKVS